MSAPRYAIDNVWDFLNVPEDRLDECLREFKIMLGMARGMCGLVDAVADEMYGPGRIKTLPKSFVWIDDGLGIAHCHVWSSAEAAAANAALSPEPQQDTPNG